MLVRPNVERALEWIDRYGDSDGDGLQEYATRSSHGYYNQGWKDAEDAVLDSEGVKAPLADRALRAPGLRRRGKASLGRRARIGSRRRPDGPHGSAPRPTGSPSRSRSASGGSPKAPTTSGSTATNARSRQSPRMPAICSGPRRSCPDRAARGRDAVARAGHVQRVGDPDARLVPQGVQPFRLPPRHGLAARQRHCRGRLSPLRPRRRGGEGGGGHLRRRAAFRGLSAAGAVRGACERRRRVSLCRIWERTSPKPGRRARWSTS